MEDTGKTLDRELLKVLNITKDKISIEVPSTCILNDIEYEITKIGKYAFKDFDNLQEITLPTSIKEIEDGAFWNCKSLKKVNLTDEIKCIGKGIFKNCTSLENIEIPQKIRIINTGSFFNKCYIAQKIAHNKKRGFYAVYFIRKN